MRKKIVSLLIAVVMMITVSSTLVGCSTRVGGTMVLSASSDFGGTSWVFSTGGAILNHYVGATLFTAGKYQEKRMLEDFSVSADGKEWSFELKTGIKWHDGKEVTADDFVFTAEFYEKLPQTILTSIGWIKTYESYTKLDKYKFKVTLTDGNFSYWTRMGGALPKHIWENTDPTTVQQVSDLSYSINCGPFKVKEIMKDQYYTLEKFDDYYEGKPELDGIIMRIIPNADSVPVAFESGEIDVMAVNAAQVSLYENKPQQYVLYQAASNNSNVLLMDNALAKYSDVKTRQALAHLVNYTAITDTLLRGYARQATSFLSPDNSLTATGLKSYSYNVEIAKQLLAEAGWVKDAASGLLKRDGELFEVNLQYMADGTASDIVELLRTSFAAADIKLVSHLAGISGVGFANINLGILDGQRYDMKLWGTTMPSIESFEMYYGDAGLRNLYAEFGLFFYGMINNESDSLVYQQKFDALKLATGNEYQTLSKEIQAKAMTDVNLIPLYFTTSITVAVPKLKLDKAVYTADGFVYYPHLIYFTK